MRIAPRRSHAKLNRDQVFAAYTLYRNGWTLRQICEKIWRQAGYSSLHVCETQVSAAWKSYGLKMRSASERVRRAKHPGGCGRCGISKELRSYGCRTCTERHKRRRLAGVPYMTPTHYRSGEYVLVYPSGCKGCGVDVYGDEWTETCPTCIDRQRQRIKRTRGVVAQQVRDGQLEDLIGY